MSLLALLDRERTIARPGFSRLALVHSRRPCRFIWQLARRIAFSVFNNPLQRVIGVKESLKGQDWDNTTVVWIFSIAIVFLGLSAAVFGK